MGQSVGADPALISTLGITHRSAPGLRLIIAAYVCLTVAAAVRRTVPLIQLCGLLLTQLVGVIFDLAGMRFLLVTWVLFSCHRHLLVVWAVIPRAHRHNWFDSEHKKPAGAGSK